MTSVKITVAVVGALVKGIVENSCAVFADFVKRVGPGVSKLRRQPMPIPGSVHCLESVVVGSTYRIELKNGPKVRKCLALIDVTNDIQLATLAANVADLENAGRTQTFLDLQVVVVKIRRTEVLAYRIYANAGRIPGGSAIRIFASDCGTKDGAPWIRLARIGVTRWTRCDLDRIPLIAAVGLCSAERGVIGGDWRA